MKRKLLSVFLALCMTLTLVPAASAYSVQDDHGAKPDGAKFQVDYHTNADGPIKTRFFDNEGNDDWGGEDGKPGDHFWDPITLMNDDPELEGYTKAVITLSEDITLTDTTILVANGHDVTINGDGHTITCILTGSVGNNPGSEHVAGQDAIYIGGDNEENKLTLRNVSVEIKGPQAEGITNQIGNKDTQGIYNDGELHLYEGAKVMVDGVSQNGINGSGTTFVCDKGTILDVRNVGGSGIEGRYVSLHDGAAVTVNNTGAHGLTVVQLDVTNASVTTTDTILYGVISNLITLKEDSTLSATCAEDAEVPAPIRVLGGGKFDVAASATVIGTAWADNVTGDGRDNVNILTSAATIGNTKYATLKDAVNGATENDIIRLCRDVTLTEKLTIDKEIILDGSGQTIIGQKNSSDVFLEVTGNDVTLQNLKAKDFGGSVVVTQGNTNLTITGCTFGADGAKVKNGVSMNTGDGDSFVTMLDTTIAATDHVAILNSVADSDRTGISQMTIDGGYYTGTFEINQNPSELNNCYLRIDSGYFTSDPTDYVSEWSSLQESDRSEYEFMVVGPPIRPDNAKFQVRYYTEMGGKLIDTRYFENSNNDDSFGGKRDHIWDPVAVMKDDPALADKGCTYASITLYEDISLEDTTIFVDEGTCVAIYSDNGDAAGHTITCKLSGNVSTAQDDSRAGMDAISVASGEHGLGTMPENHLTFYNVNVDIIGPTSSRASGGGTGTNITHGINNGCRINLQDGTSVSIDGVTGNGVNGSGELFLVDNYMTPNTVNLDIKNVGGSGIKASYLSTYDREIAVTVDNASEYGIDVDELNMYNSSITTTNTGLYGVTVANGIELGWGSSISATLQDNAAVPAPIRLENGELYAIFDNITVNGTVLLGDNATVTGEGKDNVKTMLSLIHISEPTRPY